MAQICDSQARSIIIFFVRLSCALFAVEAFVDGVVALVLWDDVLHLPYCSHVIIVTGDGDQLVDVTTEVTQLT